MNLQDRLSAVGLTGQHSKTSEPFAEEDKRNNPTKYYKLQSLDPYRKVYQYISLSFYLEPIQTDFQRC